MLEQGIFSTQGIAGGLLVLSSLIFLVAGWLYWGRAMQGWPAGKSHRYLIWERGFVIAALLIAVVGLALLERLLEAAGDHILAPAGLVILLVGAAVVIFDEAFFVSRQEWVYGPVVAFVVLAFLAQAAFGASLLRTGLLPAWIGWTAILWNLGWLVVLPIAHPQEIYYPWLHYVAPLLIGIGLLVKG